MNKPKLSAGSSPPWWWSKGAKLAIVIPSGRKPGGLGGIGSSMGEDAERCPETNRKNTARLEARGLNFIQYVYRNAT